MEHNKWVVRVLNESNDVLKSLCSQKRNNACSGISRVKVILINRKSLVPVVEDLVYY